jgi:uncharacterized membrane protein YhhN
LSLILLAAALIFGALHILADYQHQWARTYIYKPMAMAGIIGLVLTPGIPADYYQWAIVAGLLLSLAGDIFLMLRPARFLPGLFSFLVAHVVYTAAFSWRLDEVHFLFAAVPVAAGAGMLGLLWPGLGRLRIPVTLYVAAITAMVVSAVSAATGTPDPGRCAAAVGAVLFMASDACLGYARFRRNFPAAQGLILGSYYPAQALIALSAGSLYA